MAESSIFADTGHGTGPLNTRAFNLATAYTQSPLRLLAQPPQIVRVKAKGTVSPNGTITSIFDVYDLTRVRMLIGQLQTKDLMRAKDFFKGDHWRKGNEWNGPCPSEGDPERGRVMEMIHKGFVSKNAVAEVVNRHADGILSRLESSWFFVPTVGSTGIGPDIDVRGPIGPEPTNAVGDQPPVDPNSPTPVANPNTPQLPNDSAMTPNQKLCIEVEPILKKWWKEKGVSEEVRKAVEALLWGGRGGLRLFIPVGKLVNGQIPQEDTLEEQLEYIYVEHPDPDTATLALDRATMEQVAMNLQWIYDPTARRQYLYVEIAFVDFNTGLTIIKFDTDNPMAQPTTVVVDFNRQNIFYEMQQDPMITESVLSSQRLLNKSLTMMSRNVDLGGFLERVILNANLPGEWVSDKSAPTGKRFVPRPIPVGSGKITTLTSQVIEDEEGKKTVLPVSVIYRDPVSIDTFSETKREAYAAILEDCEQAHMLTAGDQFASGEARIQARANFATSLNRTKPKVDNLIVWLLDTVLQMAATFSGDVGKYESIKAVSDLRPDVGPLTPAERTVVIEMYKTGLMARATAMVMLGIDNPNEEILRIKDEKTITTPLEKAAILTALSKTGWSLAWDQLPDVDDFILGLQRRDIDKYVSQLKQEAEIEAPSGGNSGEMGGSPKGSTNKPHSQDPGPSGDG